MKIDTIYLDMDGVLCDFVSAAVKAHGLDPEATLKTWPKGVYAMEQIVGVHMSMFWHAIDEIGAEFWEDLKPYPWMRRVWDQAKTVTPDVVLLTSPSLSPHSTAGKHRWIQRHFGYRFRDYAICPEKSRIARPGALLIDDCQANVDKWQNKGGVTCLFPQPWNNATGGWEDVISVLTNLNAGDR